MNFEPFDEVTWGPSAAIHGGTPGEKNTLFSQLIPQRLHVDIHPNPFSPDGDGQNDACLITVQLPAAQYQRRLGLRPIGTITFIFKKEKRYSVRKRH